MKKISLLHLITELEPAGAEVLLVNTLKKLDKRRFNIFVGYIYGQGTLVKELKKTNIVLLP